MTLGCDHTCHVGFHHKNVQAGCKASSNYGKVVKALALLLGICVWYPPDKQQAVGNLRPPLPLRPKPVRRPGLTNCLQNRNVSLNYLQAHSWKECSGTRLLHRGGFHNCPHSVHPQPSWGAKSVNVKTWPACTEIQVWMDVLHNIKTKLI